MLNGAILSRVVREGVSEKVIFEPGVGAGETVSHVTIWGQRNNCKGSEEGLQLSLQHSNTEKRLWFQVTQRMEKGQGEVRE